MQIRLIPLCCLCLCSAAFSQDKPVIPSYELTTEVKLSSNRVSRGVTDSALRPSASVTVNFVHETGLAALAEIATVSKSLFTNGNGAMAILGGGYRNGDPDGFHYGAGLYYELFPGASYNAPQSQAQALSGDTTKVKFNTGYGILEAGFGPIDVRYEHTLTRRIRGISSAALCNAEVPGSLAQFNCFGQDDLSSRGTGYISVIGKHNLTPALLLSGHIGRQNTKNFSAFNFTDYRLSLDYTTGKWVVGGDLTAAKVKRQDLYTFTRSNGSTYKANKTSVALRVGYKF